jgi:hypothetical protein
MTVLNYGPDPSTLLIVALAIVVLVEQFILARHHGRHR